MRKGIKWDKFDTLKLYIIMEPDNTNIKPFIKINFCDIFLFTKNNLFINSNDLENK